MNGVMGRGLRAFRHTLGDDAHCFYPGRCDWRSQLRSNEYSPRSLQNSDFQ
jgi:hypothetical protein